MQFKKLAPELFPEDIQEQFDTIYFNSFAIFITKIVDGPQKLTKSWHQLEDFASGFIQNDKKLVAREFADPDIIWDMYIVLFTEFTPSHKHKYQIENSRFFCKKIVKRYNQELNLEQNLRTITLFASFQRGKNIFNRVKESHFLKLLKEEKEELPDTFFESLKDLPEREYTQLIKDWLERFDKNV